MREPVSDVRLKQRRAEYGASMGQLALLVLAALCTGGAIVLAVI
jgi:hypothetical protein